MFDQTLGWNNPAYFWNRNWLKWQFYVFKMYILNPAIGLEIDLLYDILTQNAGFWVTHLTTLLGQA